LVAYLALIVLVNSTENLDQAALARAILTYQDMYLALPDVKIHVIQGHHAWELLGDAPHFKYLSRFGHHYALPETRVPVAVAHEACARRALKNPLRGSIRTLKTY
jgi:hypothetical protein